MPGKKLLILILLIAVSALSPGCATHVVNKPQSTLNPPPMYNFAQYRLFQMRPVILNPQYVDGGPNDRAAAKIQEVLTAGTSAMLKSWNVTGRPATRGTLIIQPQIVEIKFISTGARIWVGAMAGSSMVVMKVYFVDGQTGQDIAVADFYQHANAMGGSFSAGGTDNAMLHRVANMVADYIRNNFDTAVGGRTGTGEE